MDKDAAPGRGRITLMAMAHPWHCDVMGHMNTRHYAAFFDDASYQVLEALTAGAATGRGWADVRHEFDFRHEAPAGTPLTVRSRIERIGTTSVATRHAMWHSHRALLLAEAMIVSVRFDLTARAAVALEPEVRRAAEAWQQAESSPD